MESTFKITEAQSQSLSADIASLNQLAALHSRIRTDFLLAETQVTTRLLEQKKAINESIKAIAISLGVPEGELNSWSLNPETGEFTKRP